jgi:hypothetical protein
MAGKHLVPLTGSHWLAQSLTNRLTLLVNVDVGRLVIVRHKVLAKIPYHLYHQRLQYRRIQNAALA